jgi:hypothetical protein
MPVAGIVPPSGKHHSMDVIEREFSLIVPVLVATGIA